MLLDGDLWLRNASHANAMAARPHERVRDLPGLTVTQPVRVNSVFVSLPAPVLAALHERSHFYDWGPGEARWMTSFDTTAEDADAFADAVGAALEGRR